jgi:hypothetical protein
MVTSFAEAVEALYRAPLDAFVAERKRLATELKANSDKPGAVRLVKLARPPLSTWVVNQLWWQARDLFDELFASATRLRAGDLRATSAHREAIAALRARAVTILTAAGHATTDATLRRVTTNLSALAAAGGFQPDSAGALTADREAPGFEAAGSPLSTASSVAEVGQRERSGRIEVRPETTTPAQIVSARPRPEPANQNQLAEPQSREQPSERRRTEQAEQRRVAEQAEQRRVAEQAEQRRVAEQAEERRVAEQAEQRRVAELAEQRRVAEHARQAEVERQREEARRRAERQQLQEQLRSLHGQREARLREAQRLRQALALAELELGRVDSKVTTLDARLAELERLTLSRV